MENQINDQYLIEEILDMAPRPSTNHMELMSEIWLQLKNYFGKKCIVANESSLYLTKEDVNEFKNDVGKLINLYKNTKETIPDIAVYCDKNQRFLKGYVGIPQLVVEIVSPTSVKMDLIKKKELYKEFNVLEYWAIDPIDKEIIIFTDGKEFSYELSDKVSSHKFEGLVIDLSEVELI